MRQYMMVVVVVCHTESTFDPRSHHTKHGHLLVDSARGCQVTFIPTQRHSQVFLLSDFVKSLRESWDSTAEAQGPRNSSK